jgi:hypothetical protein
VSFTHTNRFGFAERTTVAAGGWMDKGDDMDAEERGKSLAHIEIEARFLCIASRSLVTTMTELPCFIKHNKALNHCTQ